MADKQIPFKLFCDLCEHLQKLTKPSEKDVLLSKFIIEYKKLDVETRLKDGSTEKATFYPALRLLLPQYERERGPYGLKETAFAKLYQKTLCLQGNDANSLLSYKLNTNSKKGKDFADVVYYVLRKWCPEKSSLTLADINRYLDSLASLHAEHKPRDIETTLDRLIRLSTARDQKWIIRIILKDMKLGLGNDRILKIFHQDAPDLFDVCSNLFKVCNDLNNYDVRLHELDITVFTPFRPMLSLRCDSVVLNTVLKTVRLFYVENKFDGERFQLHMQDGIFKYFSKNGYEYTNIYGDTYDSSGFITPYLRAMFRNVTNIILDGEMMGWNTRTNKFGSKGMNYDVKNLKNDSVHRPCYCVFDILLYNNRTLTSVPLSERLQILNSLVNDIEGIILKSTYIEVKTKEDILRELNKSADNKEEGICFKDPDSIYKPNNRKAGWWKMKLEFFDGLLTELDILIIGGYYGEGKRRGIINGFLLAVAVPPENTSESPTEFHSFAKVANGFTVDELDDLVDKLKPYWNLVEKNILPEGIMWKNEKPDVWIEPRKSQILQIKASELIRSSGFATEYTLRFPRMEKIRYDKPWYNCMTTAELKELTISSKSVEKLNNKHITTDDIEVTERKKSRKCFIQTLMPTLGNQSLKSKLLDNKEICVFSGNALYNKEQIEMKILENGGKVVQYDGASTYCILVGDITPRIQLFIKDNPRDIVQLDWFIRAMDLSSKTLLKWIPEDLISMSQKTKNMFSYSYDKYGDSYINPTTRQKLNIVEDNINKQGDYLNLIPNEIFEFDKLLSFTNPLGLFRMCFAYFDKFTTCNDMTSVKSDLLKNSELDFRFFGGNICDVLEYHTTHIIIHSSDLSRIEDMKQKLLEEDFQHIKIVNVTWIEECILSGIKLIEEIYIL